MACQWNSIPLLTSPWRTTFLSIPQLPLKSLLIYNTILHWCSLHLDLIKKKGFSFQSTPFSMAGTWITHFTKIDIVFFFQIKKLFHYSNYQTPICLVGKTTRPFRYDLNEIPYDYTVEVRNRFQGLDLIDRGPENYGQRFVTLYRRQGSKPSQEK